MEKKMSEFDVGARLILGLSFLLATLMTVTTTVQVAGWILGFALIQTAVFEY
ncbi:MAG: hypothetical protein ACE5PM_09825 [Candidatus Hydrothermarchaeales archaeon]